MVNDGPKKLPKTTSFPDALFLHFPWDSPTISAGRSNSERLWARSPNPKVINMHALEKVLTNETPSIHKSICIPQYIAFRWHHNAPTSPEKFRFNKPSSRPATLDFMANSWKSTSLLQVTYRIFTFASGHQIHERLSAPEQECAVQLAGSLTVSEVAFI